MFTEACWIGHLTFAMFQVFQGHTRVIRPARGAGATNCTGTTSFGCILWIAASTTMSARISRPALSKRSKPDC